MQQLADNAVTAARDKFSISLDFTENSLQQLEILLQQAHEGYEQGKSSGNWSNAAIENTVRVWGSYFGEIIRRSLGGDWIVDQKNVFLQIGTRKLDPLGQVRLQIMNGSQSSVKAFYQGLKPGIHDIQNVQSINPESDNNDLQKQKAEQGRNKNSNSIIIGGFFGILILFSLCIIGIWFLSRQGVLALPAIGIPLLSSPLQTKTLVPTATFFSTNTSSPTQIPLANLDIKNLLITAEDLSLGGVYNSAGIEKCIPPSNPDALFWEFFNVPTDPDVKTDFTYLGTNMCGGSGIQVAEKLFIEKDERRAARLAESAKPIIENAMGPLWGSSKFVKVEFGAQSYWVSIPDLGSETGKVLYVVAQYNEAVFIIYIVSDQTLISQDIADITNAEFNRIHTAQFPSH